MNARSIAVSLAAALVPALSVPTDGPAEAGPGARILVGPNVQVSRSGATRPHFEVVIVADPKNDALLLAGSIVVPPAGGAGDEGTSVVVYRSADGGANWEPVLHRSGKKGKFGFADPAVAFGPDGSAYAAALESPSDRVDDTYMEVVPSRDGGKTWEAPVRIEGALDRPFLAVDQASDRFRGHLYCTCSVIEAGKAYPGVCRSRDGARTLGRPRPIESTGGRGFPIAGQGGVLSDGTLIVPFRILAGTSAPEKTHAPKARFAVLVARSTNGGESFLEGQTVVEADFSPSAYDIMPMLAVDPGSKAFPDRIYLVWSQATPGGKRVMFTFSKDKGATWAKPAVIREDAKPKDGQAATSYHADLPAVAVNREGVVAVTWYRFGQSREGRSSCSVEFVASLDGGTRWLPGARITDKDSPFGHDRSGGSVGDTAGLAADAGGEFHPLWIDNRTGVRQVFTSRVQVRPAEPSKTRVDR